VTIKTGDEERRTRTEGRRNGETRVRVRELEGERMKRLKMRKRESQRK
jgi:hypothetical protein